MITTTARTNKGEKEEEVMGWRDGMAWVFLFIILARRWTGIIAVTASALAD
jgi:hypothetical protein